MAMTETSVNTESLIHSTGHKHIFDLVKYRAWWLVLSAILVFPGLFAMIYSCMTYPTHAPLKVGIDYTGGSVAQYSTTKDIKSNEIAQTRNKLEKAGFEDPFLQVIQINPNNAKTKGIKSVLSVRTKFLGEKNTAELDKVTSIVKAEYPGSQLVQVSSIGPTLGSELFKNSMFALGLAFLGIVLYLTIRFQFDFAIAAILGLVHDALFVAGCFSIMGLLMGKQIDGMFITAILTVISFSVHDTIVVFDRIRENLRYYSKKMTFGEIVNFSVNQTFVRSINTSLTTILTLSALYFFGGVTTKDFVLAMILGIAIGTYSSIFFASIVLDFWRTRKSAQKAIK
ncbi:protein translocase subunit SecF [bacterium]|nr:protein translocase subunit SecF [bacterium]